MITVADMVMPKNLRAILVAAELDKECIYGTEQYLCPNDQAWKSYLELQRIGEDVSITFASLTYVSPPEPLETINFRDSRSRVVAL